MKDFIKFFKNADFFSQLNIFKSFFQLPACVYHELCHILMIVLFLKKINYIKCVYFYKVFWGLKEVKESVQLKNGRSYPTSIIIYDSLQTYKFEISHVSHTKLCKILVSVAPLIGIAISFFISPYLFIYLLLSYRTACLSEQDFSNVTECSELCFEYCKTYYSTLNMDALIKLKKESLTKIIKQGNCVGIPCNDCYFYEEQIMESLCQIIEVKNPINTAADYNKAKVENAKKALRKYKLKRIVK